MGLWKKSPPPKKKYDSVTKRPCLGRVSNLRHDVEKIVGGVLPLFVHKVGVRREVALGLESIQWTHFNHDLRSELNKGKIQVKKWGLLLM
jgi:hypothetical protein